MTRLEPFDGVTRLPMSKVSAHLDNLSSFSAIKLDIWAQKSRLYEKLGRERPQLSWIERLPSKQLQIQSKSLLRLRLRVRGHPWPAPKLLQPLQFKILRYPVIRKSRREATH